MGIQKERECFKNWWAAAKQTLKCDDYTAFEIWQAAKAQAVPEWISVEDQMPTENGNYLVCIDGDVFYLTAKWVKNHFKFLARGHGLTEDFTDWRYCEGVKVTHWMPLPQSVAQEQKG